MRPHHGAFGIIIKLVPDLSQPDDGGAVAHRGKTLSPGV
jgi:hypothetical protein